MRPEIGKTVDLPFEAAVAKAEGALSEQGFGILTRIDVQHAMKEKLGIDYPRFVILGACNPPLAHRAITTVPEIGVLLPCNVVVRERPDGQVRVEAINADTMAALIPGEDLREVATDVKQRLEKVLAAI